MLGKHLFQLSCRQPVARHIDDVVRARHDVEISVLVLVARVTGLVIAGERRQVFLYKGLIRAPYRRQAGRRQRELHGNGAKLAGAPRRPVLGENVDLIAWHRHRW